MVAKSRKAPSHADPGLVDRYQAEWIAAHRKLPGAHVHVGRDVAWMVQPGGVWGNAAAGIRLGRAAESRLDQIIARYRSDGRGGGFWVGPDSTPDRIQALLRERGFRCRKRFPGMWTATRPAASSAPPRGVRIEIIEDRAVFERSPTGHPYFGPVTTPLRRYEMARLSYLTSQRPQRTLELVAWQDELPIGACTVHIGSEVAGLHDVGVVPAHRRRGVGAALTSAAVGLAADHGRQAAVLIAAGMGESVYRRVGFREVCRMAYWYRAF